jgi:hypothetical protein
MKAFVSVALIVWAATANAQTAKPPVPSTLSEVTHYRKSDNSLQKLEKGKAEFVTKTKGMGFGGAATNFVLDGDKASVRIVSADTVSFIVALAEGMGDPSGWFSLFRVEVKKGKRIANYVNTKVYGGKSGSGDGIVSYTVRKLGDQVYEIIPSVKLEPGEYFFVNRGTLANHGGKGADAFAFGID